VPPLKIERIGLDDLVDERRALASRVGNVFATPEFLHTWWCHFGAGRQLELRAVTGSDGALAGVLPLYRWRPGALRFIGHGGGDALGPVATSEARDEVARAVRALPGLVVCEHVSPAWASAMGVEVVLEEGSPVLPVNEHESWDAYLGSRSSNFRQQVRSRTRRLERDYDVRVRLADESTLEGDLDTLFRLHRARWDRPSTFGSREAFHRDFARVGLERGWTRLMILEVEGTPAAAWYGFRFGDAGSYYQSGRDPARTADSVGLVLLAHTVRAAFEDGRAEYRFLRGDEPYKYRFADDRSHVVSGIAGRGAAPAAAGLRALRAGARRLRQFRQRARPAGGSRPAA